MNICDWYLFQGVGNVIGFQPIVKPMLTGLPPDEAAIAAANPKAQLVFRELSLFLGQNRWFAGEMFSLADIVIAATALVNDLVVLTSNSRHFDVLKVRHLDPATAEL